MFVPFHWQTMFSNGDKLKETNHICLIGPESLYTFPGFTLIAIDNISETLVLNGSGHSGDSVLPGFLWPASGRDPFVEPPSLHARRLAFLTASIPVSP